MKLDAEAKHHVGKAWSKLVERLLAKQDELRRREASQGKSHDVQKMNRLRDEIASLEARLNRAENLLESTA